MAEPDVNRPWHAQPPAIDQVSTRELAREALAAIALGKAKYERIAESYPVGRLAEDDQWRLRRATLDSPLDELYALIAELFPDRATTTPEGRRQGGRDERQGPEGLSSAQTA